MGREARCACRWGDREGLVIARLEFDELSVRGAIRARAKRRAIEDVGVRGDALTFACGAERVELELGAAAAKRWAAALAEPPPSLAHKLGLSATTLLHVRGRIDDDALRDAIDQVAQTSVPVARATVALVRTDELSELVAALDVLTAADVRIPLWVVYRKGRGAPLGETAVRELLRERGYVDTKVCAVSAPLTAARFSRR